MRVLCPTGLGASPDGSIVCGQAEYLDARQDTLLNPLVIFEVLSPTTQAYDRGRKFQNYQTLRFLRIRRGEPAIASLHGSFRSSTLGGCLSIV